MTPPLPTRDALKRQAKLLRADLAAQGTKLSHAAVLEMLAHQWGMRDWNTLSAKSATTPQVWHPGQKVQGRYLGHAFTGVLKATKLHTNGNWSVTVRFDAPVDVVESAHFKSMRRQVTATLTPEGRTLERISSGTPHMTLLQA